MPSKVELVLIAALALVPPAAAQDGPPVSDGPQATSDRSPDRYDEVGYATWYGPELAGSRTASGLPFDPRAFTAAHRSLPIGSYVEVTSLETGRTVLVLVNDRGPSTPGALIDLSQAAARAIGVTSRKPVRIRRVNPTPADQTALKNGKAASPVLDTPPVLLTGLRARLAAAGPEIVAAPARGQVEFKPRPPVRPASSAPRPISIAPVQPPIVPKRGYYVQIAAFGGRDRAEAVARGLNGTATPFNKLWRVRTGPFATAKSAAQARDAMAARGYGDARVVRED